MSWNDASPYADLISGSVMANCENTCRAPFSARRLVADQHWSESNRSEKVAMAGRRRH
jgi:hypothetical protein